MPISDHPIKKQIQAIRRENDTPFALAVQAVNDALMTAYFSSTLAIDLMRYIAEMKGKTDIDNSVELRAALSEKRFPSIHIYGHDDIRIDGRLLTPNSFIHFLTHEAFDRTTPIPMVLPPLE